MLKQDFGCESDDTNSGKPRKKPFLELLLQVHLRDSSFTEENIREEVDTFMFEVILNFHIYFIFISYITIYLYFTTNHPRIWNVELMK